MLAPTVPPPAQTPAEWLRAQVSARRFLALPGAYDAVTARLIGASGAEALYMGGYAAIASSYALPDVGLVQGSELVDVYRRVATVTDLPLVVDADTGYGGVINVRRTVDSLVAAGVAGFHIEDQANPKRCGHLNSKVVVPLAAAVSRVSAAVAAASEAGRHAPVVIARTDALQPEGVSAAIERARAFMGAGADAVFIDAIPDVNTMKHIRDHVDGPLLFNAASTGKSPRLSSDQLAELGYSIVIYPIELLLAALSASAETLGKLGRADTAPPWPSFSELNALLELPRYEQWEQRFPDDGAADEPAAGSPSILRNTKE
jgi:2,3-dimethylmalate lyase